MHCTLATGESLYSRFEFQRLLALRACDIIQPDICVVGGVLEMCKIAALAETHYVTIAPHNPMGPLATAIKRGVIRSAVNMIRTDVAPARSTALRTSVSICARASAFNPDTSSISETAPSAIFRPLARAPATAEMT